jgi:hypothetical protein
MHARSDRRDEPARRLACHRGPVQPADTVCLRAVCGHDATAESPGVALAVLRVPARLALALASAPVRALDFRIALLSPPEPPTHPPRSVRG